LIALIAKARVFVCRLIIGNRSTTHVLA
jgi:hypothetical protein